MKLIVYVSALVLSASPALAAEKQQLSGLELQQFQAKDFETTVGILFPAIMTVLQDSGYRITEANKDTGFISGIGSAEQKMIYNIWWGFGKKKTVPMVSVFVEQRGPSIARARLSFVWSTGKSRNAMTDEKPITDPTVYRDAFEKIEKEIFVRTAMNVPAAAVPTSVSAPVSTAAVSSATPPPEPSSAK